MAKTRIEPAGLSLDSPRNEAKVLDEGLARYRNMLDHRQRRWQRLRQKTK